LELFGCFPNQTIGSSGKDNCSTLTPALCLIPEAAFHRHY
jgi:hypothetical protein